MYRPSSGPLPGRALHKKKGIVRHFEQHLRQTFYKKKNKSNVSVRLLIRRVLFRHFATITNRGCDIIYEQIEEAS